MATPIRPYASPSEATSRVIDRELTALVDAIVAAVDINHTAEVDQVTLALEPFGGSSMFRDELRLNGTTSIGDWCICDGWEVF